MKRLAFALLVLSVAACAPRKQHKGARGPAPVANESQPLAAKDENGLSKNEFDVPVNASVTGSYVSVPFHFNMEQYKSFVVSEPVIAGVNCAQEKEAKLIRSGKGGSTRLFWVKGKAPMSRKPNLKYDKEQVAGENATATVSHLIFVPAGCTGVHGSFEVKFKKPTASDGAGKK